MELDYVKLKDIKPVLSGYINRSKLMLKKSDVPDEKVVHDVRVLMKKSRAVLKLVAPQLENDFSAKDIVSFREVGRKLSSWRDTSVHWRTLKDLRKEFPELFSRLQENDKVAALFIKADPEQELSADVKASLEEIDDLLEKAGYRIRFQSMDKIDPHLLLKELEMTYLKVTEKYISCRNDPKNENIHEFRKRAKDFLYQLYFFRPLNVAVIKTLEKRLDSITQNLGRYNDLAQLVNELGYNYKDKANTPFLDEMVIIVREKQDSYLAKVWPSAYKVFCPGTKLVNVLGFKLLVI